MILGDEVLNCLNANIDMEDCTFHCHEQGWREKKERKLCEEKKEEEETKDGNQNMTASEWVIVLLFYGGM
jgi:hypothetical protein